MTYPKKLAGYVEPAKPLNYSHTMMGYEGFVNRIRRHQPKHGKPSGASKLQKRAGREDARDARHEAKLETAFKRHHESLGRVVSEVHEPALNKTFKVWRFPVPALINA